MPKRFEEHPGSEFDRLFYMASHAAFKGLGRLVFRYRIEGAENFPETGRVLVGFNHPGTASTIFGPDAIPRFVSVYGRRKYMEAPVVGWILRSWGAETIDRPEEGESLSRDMFDIIKAPLLKDRAALMFVSGTRTHGTKPSWPKRGIAKFAQDTSSPVLPAVLRGTDMLSQRRITAKFDSQLMGPPEHRRQHDAFLYEFMNRQRALFDSIEDGLVYADPLEPVVANYLGGEFPEEAGDFVKAYRQYLKDNDIQEEAA